MKEFNKVIMEDIIKLMVINKYWIMVIKLMVINKY
jgi:hypothetical protein